MADLSIVKDVNNKNQYWQQSFYASYNELVLRFGEPNNIKLRDTYYSWNFMLRGDQDKICTLMDYKLFSDPQVDADSRINWLIKADNPSDGADLLNLLLLIIRKHKFYGYNAILITKRKDVLVAEKIGDTEHKVKFPKKLMNRDGQIYIVDKLTWVDPYYIIEGTPKLIN